SNLVQIGSDRDWREIWSGENYFVARKADGTWWSCGKSPAAHLGLPWLANRSGDVEKTPRRLPHTFEPWALTCGDSSVGLLTRDGVVWTWGTRLGARPQLDW